MPLNNSDQVEALRKISKTLVMKDFKLILYGTLKNELVQRPMSRKASENLIQIL
jgi:hypothetical protein